MCVVIGGSYIENKAACLNWPLCSQAAVFWVFAARENTRQFSILCVLNFVYRFSRKVNIIFSRSQQQLWIILVLLFLSLGGCSFENKKNLIGNLGRWKLNLFLGIYAKCIYTCSLYINLKDFLRLFVVNSVYILFCPFNFNVYWIQSSYNTRFKNNWKGNIPMTRSDGRLVSLSCRLNYAMLSAKNCLRPKGYEEER